MEVMTAERDWREFDDPIQVPGVGYHAFERRGSSYDVV